MVDLIKKNAKSLQESLFSSVGSAVLTIATTYLVINFFRGMLGFALTSDKDWLAVLNNMQLYMVQAYPEEDFIRVWLSVGLTFVLAGLSIGIWRSDDRVKSSQIFNSFCRIIKSEFCRPPNIVSRSANPDITPEYFPFYLNAFSTNWRDDFVTDAKSLRS